MNIDFSSLTLDEIETIENLTQKSIETIMDAGVPRGRVLKALIYVVTLRTNPEYTIQDAGKLSLTEATNLFNDLENPKD